MLKLLPPEENKFHNFKCGEVYCVSPSAYQVACCLCGEKVRFAKFPEHFQKQHLGATTGCGMPSQEASEVPPSYILEVDPIKSEEEDDDANNEQEFQSLDALDEELDEKPIDYVDLQLGADVAMMDDIKDDTNDGDESNDDNKDWNWVDKLSDSDESEADSSSAKPKPDLPFKCTHCERSYKSRRALSNHRRLNHNIITRIKTDPCEKNKEQWQCKTCPRIYKSRRALSNHLRTGCGGTPARQTRIKTTTPTSGDNTDTPTDAQPNDASSDEINPDTIVSSTAAPEPAPAVQHKCTECGEVFRRESHLRSHMFKHTGIVCDICGKSFTQLGNMNRHKIRHTGIKAHKCTECDNCFFTDKELNAHMMRHTQIFPHICEVCGRRCRDRGVLTAHMRRHTGERPAECKVCGKRFFCGFDLNVHSVTHTTERPFKCDVCGATFQRKKSLRVHKKLHSSERNHECKVCGKTFAQSSGLVSHMRSHDATTVRGVVTPAAVVVDSGNGNAVEVGTFANMCDIFS